MAHSDRRRTWHIVTGEYPPDMGGVSDYSTTIAHALASAGDQVHVWTSGRGGTTTGRVSVHRVFGSFTVRDLAHGRRLLEACREDGRLLVQWVPHAFGARGVNLRFPFWLHAESVRRLDAIDVMIHEPFMPFAGPARRHAAAAAQRLMTATVLRSATRAFAATPAWIDMCRPLARRVHFHWTPIPSGVPMTATRGEVAEYRRRLNLQDGDRLIGCFGRAGAFQHTVLEELGRTLRGGLEARLLLIGLGSDAAAARMIERTPGLRSVVLASGPMNHAALSAALCACDVMIQPYEAGICTRHSSATALLAHGRPIVTNPGPFTEPFWTQSGAVRISSAATPAALASAVIQLLGNPDERARLSRAATDLYDVRFHVRHTVAALRD
jgi:glycosyltransferase involved in cell wall biosynthesis